MRTGWENQHFLKALSVRIRFICKHQDTHKSSGGTGWTLASLSPTGNPEAGGAGWKASSTHLLPVPGCLPLTLPPSPGGGGSSNMVQGCLLEHLVRPTGWRKERREKNKGCTLLFPGRCCPERLLSFHFIGSDCVSQIYPA